jgi:DNA-binding LytR/AlgR family response regulator
LGAVDREFDRDDLYEVDSAFQGRDAVTLVEKALSEGRPYAMAFVDIRMPPGWDGIRTVRQIWAIDPEILIVLCSAYSDYAWEDIVRELGRTDRFLILRKPFDNIEVRQCAQIGRAGDRPAAALTGCSTVARFRSTCVANGHYARRSPVACVRSTWITSRASRPLRPPGRRQC